MDSLRLMRLKETKNLVRRDAEKGVFEKFKTRSRNRPVRVNFLGPVWYLLKIMDMSALVP